LVERINAGPKRYVVYNKVDFSKKSGIHAKGLSLMATLPGYAGELRHVTGVRFTGDVPEQVFQHEDWVIQEEHTDWHIVGGETCYKQSTIPCPGSPGPVPPTPTAPPGCPNCPLPTATPGPVAGNFQWWGSMVHAGEAWSRGFDGSSVLVCIADTGIDKNHEDLRGAISGGTNTVDGGDYQDDQGHGTHVAGIIAGRGPHITGVSRAKIYAVKVMDSRGSGMSSWIADGIMACVAAGAKVINLSLGSDRPDQLIHRAVVAARDSGVVVVAAAGNSGGSVGYPAAYPEAIAISSINRSGQLSSFSSRGLSVDFAAPGEDILSLRLGGSGDRATVSMSGTSMACPNAAGVFAIALGAGRDKVTGISLGLPRDHQGVGLVDAEASVK